MEYNELFDMMLDYVKKLLYPEEWISLDTSFSKSELFAMIIIDRRGEIIMSEIADFVNVPMSTATGIIDRLVKKAYIKRERNETDRRIVSLKLTEKGNEIVGKLKDILMEYFQLLNENLTNEEIQVLYKILARIPKILESKKSIRTDADVGKKELQKINIE